MLMQMMRSKQFGGRITPELEKQYSSSKHWKDGKFHNLEITGMNIRPKNVPGLIYKQITSKGRRPLRPLEVSPFARQAFLAPGGELKYAWYGHSAVLLRLNGHNILIDPMMGHDASPPAPIKTKRFSENTLSIIDDLPEIDLMLLTHDHYDHLDLASIVKLKAKVRTYFVALGVKRHLVAWGVESSLIKEFDWWDSDSFADIEITFTPSRHFSGRGLRDRFRSLWGGWALRSQGGNVYFSGDGGYGKHFREIGERLGPFDLAFMECGQYNELWHQIHMFPEESVKAAMDAGAVKAIPVHWGGFTLALHPWNEPAGRFSAEADKKGLEAVYPELGAVYKLSSGQKVKWWVGV